MPRLSPLLLLPVAAALVGCGVGAQASGARYGAWFTPSRVAAINGIAVGPINSALLHDSAQTPIRQTVNGISAELIGVGILVPLAPYAPSMRDTIAALMRRSSDSTWKELDWEYPMVNGLALSLTGSAGLGTVNGVVPSPLSGYTHRVNGAAVSLMVQFVDELNGLGVGGMVVNSYRLNGVQVGILNGTHITNGVQLGAFNSCDLLSGVQIGAANIAGQTSGAQIGVYNWGGDMRGVQMGVVNNAGPGFRGVQLGVLNIGPPGVWPLLSVVL